MLITPPTSLYVGSTQRIPRYEPSSWIVRSTGALPIGPVILPRHVPTRLAGPSIDSEGGRAAQPATSVGTARIVRAGRGIRRTARSAPPRAGARRRLPPGGPA